MKKLITLIIAAVALASCSEDTPTVNLGLEDSYYIPRLSKLILEPALSGKSYRWSVNGVDVSSEQRYIFIAKDEGLYNISFEIIDDSTPCKFDFTVNVMHEEVEYSPYISRVYDYCPAPGQFINTMPPYDEGDTPADMARKCEEAISGTNDVVVSLGGYGGYIIFGFDHTVANVHGRNDFRIWGNAFYENTDTEKKGGSAEPGIVMVSLDTNANGLPDDQWYELAGSEYANSKHNYTLTYHRPDPDRIIEADKKNFLSDVNYISWSDSDGGKGYMPKNTFHSQDYYPKWISDDEISYTGTLLPDNAVDKSGTGRYYILYCFDWGYADNHPNEITDLCSFDIDWAVDDQGRPVKLDGVDFIRVYTGCKQYCGWLGETSTEISRAMDLNISDHN